MNFETAKEIECVVATYFDAGATVIVPNVSWGMLNYECDIVVLLKSDYCAEVEIKVSRSDLIRDREKRHQHQSRLMRYLYFAIPKKLEMYIGEIPERSGVLVIDQDGRIRLVREPKTNAAAPKLEAIEKFNLARLGALRVWKLKRKVLGLKNTIAVASIVAVTTE